MSSGATTGASQGAVAEAPDGTPDIIVRRTFDAPRALVFAAWTEPEQLDVWWGPNGFTNTTKEFDFREGGVWRHNMIGPDGTDHPNRLVYREIDPPQRLVYDNGWDRDPFESMFRCEVTFTEQGDATIVEMRSRFASAAARDEVIRTFGALQGAKDTLDRLAVHVTKRRRATT